MNEVKEVYTLSEAREVLRIGRTNAYKLIKYGKLDHRHNGNRILIPRRSIDEFLYGDQSNNYPCPQCNGLQRVNKVQQLGKMTSINDFDK